MTVLIAAPLDGTAVPLAQVPDAVFAQEMLGSGAAVEPAELAGTVVAVAPVAGRVHTLHPHAAVLVTEDGTGVLVHVGIDTVKLDGAGFTVRVAVGDTVRTGDPLVEFDPAAVRAAGYSPVCPVVVLDSTAGSAHDVAVGAVAAGDSLFSWNP